MPMLDFKGKQFVYAHHLSAPFRTLEIDAKKSLPPPGGKPDLDDNLIIHGDNLHALKALLPTYAGKVDCIIIDPPYNTGNEGWCYNDNVRSPLMKEWLKKSANPVDKEDLERHDKWCCMMWPRLKLLRELLSDSGVIFTTIDDIEIGNLRKMMDEVFGEDNLLANFVWQSKDTPGNNATGIAETHNHVLAYRRSERFSVSLLERTEAQIANYSSPDDDPRGPWLGAPLTRAEHRDRDYYAIPNGNGREVFPPKGSSWRRPPAIMKQLAKDNRIWWGKSGDAAFPMEKKFLSEAKEGVVHQTWWPYGFAGSTRNSSAQMKEIFGGAKTFETPKPVTLIERMLELVGDDDSLVLDSFAGSGTTAHAVLDLNKRDGGNRRFILVECEDYADTLTAERVRRVISGYSFEGTQREELYRRKLNFTALKKADEILGSIEGIENLEGHRFDKISKAVTNDELIVTGEKKVTEKTEGLGGSFTYCTLGEEINLQTLLSGEKLPAYDALAKYVFYTATGQTLPKVPKPGKVWFIGETTLYRVHLLYKPEKKWLRSNASALTQELVDAIAKQADPSKKSLVFASTKFMGQKDLTRQHIEFCQLPYAIYRVLGD